MDVNSVASKTGVFNATLLRAWRERWTDAQWGINIKTILSRTVSGDVYNLADCIFQHAVVGSDANSLVLSYLRHSLCSRQVSHAAVLKRLSRFDGFDRSYCVNTLLDFIESIIGGVTCRSAREEVSLPNAMLSLIYWFSQIFASILEQHSGKETLDAQQQKILNQMVKLLQRIFGDPYLFGTIYVGKQEDIALCQRLQQKYLEVKTALENAKFTNLNQANDFEELLQQVAEPNKDEHSIGIASDASHENRAEPITYCLQPLIAVEVQRNPNRSTDAYVSQLLMIKQLKYYTMDRLYYEIIRASLASLCNVSGVSGTNRESMWCAFAFIKVPHILRQLHLLNPPDGENANYSSDIVAALEMLNEDPFLDFLDTKCAFNTIEYLLTELDKHGLINESHVQKFASVRDTVMISLAKIDLKNDQQPPIIKLVKCAETPLSGILMALDGEYNKMQEPLLGMLCQTLSGSGNSFELILSVAAVDGKLKTFVSRLIRCNESSKQVIGETDKVAQIRSALFDVSFLMLTFIVQAYGSEVVLDKNGDSFFEKWVREYMLERTKNKSPMNMVHQCEQSKIDEFLMTLSSIEKLKSSTLKWQDICMNLPGVLYHLLVAWENETISAAEVKTHLDSIKSRHCSFSVCAASWLCAYMQIVRDDELLKPMNMVKQLLAVVTPEEVNQPDNFKDRLGLTIQIIRKMQNDTQKIRSLSQNVSQQPLEDQFNEVWQSIAERGWLRIDVTQILDSLLHSCGPYWLVSKLVNEILHCKFAKELKKTMDIVFAIMHLNIERCTVTLLAEVMPMLLIKRSHKYELIEPQLSIMARLCVSCIVSTLQQSSAGASKKRSYNSADAGGDMNARAAKMRKLDETNASVEMMQSNEEQHLSSTEKCPESLRLTLQYLFKLFTMIYLADELTPNTVFVCKFFKILQQCGSNRIKPVLNLLPAGLIQSLLKSLSSNDFNYDFILNLYDLSSEAGRRGAMADMTLLRSIQIQKSGRQNMD